MDRHSASSTAVVNARSPHAHTMASAVSPRRSDANGSGERQSQQSQQSQQMQQMQQSQQGQQNEQNGGEPSSSPPDTSGSATKSPGVSRQPLSRRGHFKSRLGCFNCKRRRVKCNEQRPFCSPCRRLGLSCVYPTAPNSAPPPIRTNPSTLCFEDLRFYHQFLTTAFPTLPLLADETWIQSASMSHNYEYLSHAILALGASHLSQNGNVDYTAQALHHRVAAIKLVNEQLDHPPKKTADADALLATVLCLVTQSSLMPDSMIEYLTMIRGCNLVATSIVPDYDSSIFRAFTAQGHIEAIARIVSEEPKDLELIDAFHSSASSIAVLCQLPCEIMYAEFMLKGAQSMRTSSFEGWKDFVTLFMLPTTFTNEEFLSFIGPDNHVGHLLVIHMFLMDYVLGQICISPTRELKAPGRKHIIIAWARNLANSLPPAYQKFGEWPRRFCDQLENNDGRYLFSP